MTIKSRIRAALMADPTIASLVTSGAISRIYPRNLPPTFDVPAISYNVIQTRDPRTTINRLRIRFMCWSDDPDEADTLAEAVCSALTNYYSVEGSVEISNTDPEQTSDQPQDAAGLYATLAEVLVITKGE